MFRLCLIAAAVVAAPVSAGVDFAKQIKPLFEAKCLKCHGAERPRAGLRMDTRAALLKGSRDGEVVVVGKPGESYLVERIELPHDEEGVMPPEGEKFTKKQQQLVRAWITEGLKWPDGVTLKEAKEAIAPKMKPEDKGVPVTAAEKAAVAELARRGVMAMRLAQNTNWVRVDFSLRKDALNEELLARLKDINNLYELDLGGTAVTDAQMSHVAPLKNLRKLHLERTKVTDAGLAALAGLKKLEWLNLYGTPVTDAGLAPLRGLGKLGKLYLWQTKVTADAARALKKARPALNINLGVDLTAAPSAKGDGK